MKLVVWTGDQGLFTPLTWMPSLPSLPLDLFYYSFFVINRNTKETLRSSLKSDTSSAIIEYVTVRPSGYMHNAMPQRQGL